MLNDLRFAFRMLLKNPGFTAVAVLTLALGIGANTAMFSVINAVLLRSLPYKDPDRLIRIWENYPPSFERIGSSVPEFLDWSKQTQTFEQMLAYRYVKVRFNLTGERQPERLLGTYATASLFPTLGISANPGRVFVAEEDNPSAAPVVMISHDLWQQRFGGQLSLIGRPIQLDNASFTVIGILPNGFDLLDGADLWLPMGRLGSDELTNRMYHPLGVVARLRRGVSLNQAQLEMNGIAARIEQEFPKTNAGWKVRLSGLHEDQVRNQRPTLLLLLVSVSLVLLIASSNVANLLLSRATARCREISIRLALGAGRWRVVRQLLLESLIIAALGGAAGLLLAHWALSLMLALAPADIPRLQETRLDLQVFGYAGIISLLTGVIFGLVPALQATKVSLSQALKAGERRLSGGTRGSHLRSTLVISQIGLALFLLIGSGLTLKGLFRLLRVQPGFDFDKVLTAEASLLPDSKYTQERSEHFYREVRERLEALPGVKAVATSSNVPLSSKSVVQRMRFTVEGRALDKPNVFEVAEVRGISPNYFQTLGMPLLRGRLLTEHDWGKLNVIINSAMARRYWPGQDPSGKRINWSPLDSRPSWATIVGVVGDVKQFGLADQQTMDIYVSQGQFGGFLVVRTEGEPKDLVATLRDQIHAIDKDVPISDIRAMSQTLAESVSPRRFVIVLLTIFSAMALILAVIGLYSVISYSVTQRTHEIGVRMALGAQSSNVLSLVVGEGLRLILLGLVMGLAASFALSRILSSLLFEVTATDPITFGAVSAFLAAVALLACYIPARRATKVDPMEALRYE